jgi:diguanylate cyclase (GGDEF)-like protein
MRRDSEKRVTIDALTGLGNRLDAERRFEELLQLVVSRGGAVCCGYMSLMHGAKLLEQHGRDVYDDILIGVARRLRRMVRPGDVVARLSDHEFVVGMYYLDGTQVRGKTFKRVMQAINLRPIKTAAGFINVHTAMAMCCLREGQTVISAEKLMDCAGEKIDISIKTGCTEVAV